MSASRLKIVPESEAEQGRVPLDVALGLARADASPFRVLADAVQSFESLQRRCEAAEARGVEEAGRHAQALGEAEARIADKQKRIDYLEALLADFKTGLQSLARDAGQQSEDLRKSETARDELAAALARKTDELRRAQQRSILLEAQAEAAQAQYGLLVDFAARQADYLNHQELKITAETQALHETRAAMRKALDEAGRLGGRPLERVA